ncbi:hypothetical protein RQP46_010965 [Phenoliferia psychrophenolica]
MTAPNAQHLSFAKSNFSLSGSSGLYDRARPRYPPAAVQRITSLLPSGADVVELGAGTGIFSRMLLAEGKDKIKKLLAVEPAAGMRQGFMDKLAGSDVEPAKSGVAVEIVDGSFTAIPVESNSLDMVVAAQAWHWSNDGVAAVAEVARVLKPGGKLALIWNLEDRATEWVAQLRDTYEPFEAGTPQYRLGLWKAMFKSYEYIDNFEGPAEHTVYDQVVVGNEELVVDRALSKSYITSLSQEEQDVIVSKIRKIVQRGDGKEWIDEAQGTFKYPYLTDLFVMTKKA